MIFCLSDEEFGARVSLDRLPSSGLFEVDSESGEGVVKFVMLLRDSVKDAETLDTSDSSN